MKSLIRRASLAALAVALAVAPALGQSFDSPEFDAAVRRFIEANPQVVLDSVNAYVEKQRLEKEAADADAFLSMADEFTGVEGLPVVGNPDGAITMVYVLDAACTYCRRMTPVVSSLLEKNPDLRIVQFWVPFLTPASEYAGRVAGLVAERYPGKYGEFYHQLMLKTAGLTNEIVDDVIAQTIGADAVDIIRADVTTGSMSTTYADKVQANLSLSQRALISGTPFMWVEGTGRDGLFRGAAPEARIQAAIEKARAAN